MSFGLSYCNSSLFSAHFTAKHLVCKPVATAYSCPSVRPSNYSRGSRVSIAIIRICDSVCLSVCLSVCPHDKTKTAETTIVKLGTGIVNHDISPNNIESKGQKSRSQGQKVQKVATRQPCGAVSLRCDAAQRDGRRELCTLSSAQPLVQTAKHLST